MILDSHAHYAHACYRNTFRYLTREDREFALKEGSLSQLLEEMRAAGICGSIEAGIGLSANREILALAARYLRQIFPAMGVHPTRCFQEKWQDRRQLAAFAGTPAVIEKIAQIKGISPEEAERITAENAVRLFSLPI